MTKVAWQGTLHSLSPDGTAAQAALGARQHMYAQSLAPLYEGLPLPWWKIGRSFPKLLFQECQRFPVEKLSMHSLQLAQMKMQMPKRMTE